MHDIWNPWHGCVKLSEGCENCYMYFLDRIRGKDGSDIYRTKNGFNYPLSKDRKGNYKVKSGELIRVCMTSDFFLEEADRWREEAWSIIKKRCDVKFFLLTKRPQRVLENLPKNWGEGFENVILGVTSENQKRADERIPILLKLPFKHKEVVCAPFIGKISIEKYLASGRIERVVCGGENYDGARPCNFDWVKSLREECVSHNVSFAFIETGTRFIKDGKLYKLLGKRLQASQAYKSGMNFKGKPVEFILRDEWGSVISKDKLYVPRYGRNCGECASRLICNGCSDCGKC